MAMAARRLSSLISRSLGAYSSSGSASLLSSLGDDAFSVILLLSVLYLHDLCLLSNFASFFFSLDIEVCLEFGSDKLVNLELYCVRKKNNNFLFIYF